MRYRFTNQVTQFAGAAFRAACLLFGACTALGAQGFEGLIPAGNYQTVIPHTAFGGGFLTRLFVTNLGTGANTVTVNRISQSGVVVESTTATLQAGATVIVADSEAQRTQPLAIQWFAIGSARPVAASVLFEFDGQAISPPVNFRTAVGALAATPSNRFSLPIRVATANVTVGVALANVNPVSTIVNLRLLSQTGGTLAQDSLTLGPFEQTAFSIHQRPAFSGIVLAPAEFVGTLAVTTSDAALPVSGIAVGNNLQQLFSLPVIQGVANPPPTVSPPTIAVSATPVSAMIAPGTTQQFAATVIGTANTAVTWKVNGVAGGNSTVGTISPIGLYAAPASAPVPETVTVTATSAADATRGAGGAVTISLSASGQPAGITISSLSSNVANPFSTLTITGSGFTPANSAISVLFVPAGSRVPISVPVSTATSTMLTILVPPFVNPTTGAVSNGVVDLRVVQITGSFLAMSNTIAGLTINAPPPSLPGQPAGAVTRVFLGAGQQVLQAVQNLIANSPGLQRSPARPGFLTGLTSLSASQSALIAAVETIINNPSQRVTLTTTDGQPFTLDAATLATMDRLILAYGPPFAAQAQSSGGTIPSRDQSRTTGTTTRAVTTSCGLESLGDTFTDNFMCTRLQYSLNLAQTGATAVQNGARFEIEASLGLLGGWALAGFAEGGAVASTTAKALELMWGSATSYISAYATAATPPTLSESLRGAGAKLIQTFAGWGSPTLQFAADVHEAYSKAAEVGGTMAATPPPAPKGLVVGSSPTNLPANTQAVFKVGSPGVSPVAERLAAPNTQQTVSVASTFQPPADVRQFDGSYTGSYTGTQLFVGDPIPDTEGGSVNATVTNGIISATTFDPVLGISAGGAGALSSTGLVIVGTAASSFGAICTFGGQFKVTSSGATGGSGTYACTFTGGSSSGTWVVTR